jgi:hypothetical protein
MINMSKKGYIYCVFSFHLIHLRQKNAIFLNQTFMTQKG